MSRRPLPALPVVVLLSLLLAGCFTGPRATFDSTDAFQPGVPTGDANVDAILDRLDHLTRGPVTANYDVLTKYGNLDSSASVALQPGKRNVIVENTRYVQNEKGTATCTVDRTIACTSGFDPTRISDVGITVDFYGVDAAKRLRRDTQAKIGPTVPHSKTIAGQKVDCVDIPLNGGVASYCVMANGLLAQRDDGDIRIVMQKFRAAAAPADFVIPT